MITRPLDLSSKQRPEPKNFDWLFFVNAVVLVLFFSLFGSRFVLAPGLGVDFRLPEIIGANASGRIATHVITVLGSGQIFTPDGGSQTMDQLSDWLRTQAPTIKEPVLLVRSDDDVNMRVLNDIIGAAKQAGFAEVLLAGMEPENPSERKGR